jgi:diguanylate cyclase (GGDEF)-like protein
VGGEEFAVLLPSTDLDAALTVAERLRGLVASRPVAYDGAHIACTISAGVAVCDGEALGLDGLMKRADQALYAAKAAGRDRVERWHPAPDGEVKR